MNKNIDYQKVKDFFTGIIQHPVSKDVTLAATPCPDNPQGFLSYRDKSQKRQLFSLLKIPKEWAVLDLGCGTGRWALEFARKTRLVVGVDNSTDMLSLAEKEARHQAIFNVKFINSSVLDFSYPEKFDLIFLGSVLLYINDSDLKRLMINLKNLIRPYGWVILLESISIKDKVIKDSVYDEHLGTAYSVIYRNPEEYAGLFVANGFKTKYENYTLPRNLPIFLYNHFVPQAIKSNRLIIFMLKLGLNLQAYLDPYFTRMSILENRSEIYQKFFLFQYGG